MNYNAREGKKLLNSRETLSRNVSEKWNQIFSPNFKLKWQDVGVKKRSKKEVGFFWSLWHKALAINIWREKINHKIQVDCSSCEHGTLETIMHRFWQCTKTKTTWEQTFSFLYSLKSPIDVSLAWRPLSLEQYMSNKKLPSKFREFNLFWSLTKSVTF